MLTLSLGIGASAALAAGPNADFVGTWHLSNGQPLVILTQDASGACTGTAVYPMSGCQVSGNTYVFTLTTGSYVSHNHGAIASDNLSGIFSDSNGTVRSYTGTRTPKGPKVTDLSVHAGPVSGGTSVVVKGAGFGQAGDKDAVTFAIVGGGAAIPVLNPVVVSDTEIDLVTPNVRAAMPSSGALHTKIQVTDVGGHISTISDAGKFNFPLTLVEIGDSIASGEGTLYGYYYNPVTGVWGGGNPNTVWSGSHQLCHDSQAAYGQLVSDALGTNFVMLACTGATYTNGITAPEVANKTVYQPAQFPGVAYDAAEPDAVMATFGADDVQFVDIVTACIKSALADPANAVQCTLTNPGPTVQADFFGYLPTLQASYAKIAADIEARGKAASPARIPKIIFTDYMDPFPPSGGCPDTWPMTDDQVTYLNVLMADLNTGIRSAVAALAATDSNVSFADISGAIVGHTWCTPDPWDYGLSVITGGGQAAGILTASPKSQAPFHPTPAGQAAIAAIVAPVVGAALKLPVFGSITAASSGGASGAGGGGSGGSGSGTGATGVTIAPGGSVSASAAGYTPDETIIITLHSTPVVLGQATADSSGHVNVTVTIPVGTTVGSHELLLRGVTSGITSTLPLMVSPLAALPSSPVSTSPSAAASSFASALPSSVPSSATPTLSGSDMTVVLGLGLLAVVVVLIATWFGIRRSRSRRPRS
jgi:lysophospholipase L1-like esterase